MSEVKHTPAHTGRPWSAKSYGYEKYAIVDDRGTEIGFVHRRRDAHLVSAAPALYEACEWLETYARVQVDRYPDAEDNKGWRDLLAALAKARGE